MPCWSNWRGLSKRNAIGARGWMLLLGGRPRSDVGDGHVDIWLLTFWAYSQVRSRLIVFGRYGWYPWELPRGPMPRPLNATPFITHKGVIEGPERERKGV